MNESSSDFPTLHVSSHPAILHKLALLRDETTKPPQFRQLVREISWLLGYEALADARVASRPVQTPIEETDRVKELVVVDRIDGIGLAASNVTRFFPDGTTSTIWASDP